MVLDACRLSLAGFFNDSARVLHVQAHEIAHIAGTHTAQFVR